MVESREEDDEKDGTEELRQTPEGASVFSQELRSSLGNVTGALETTGSIGTPIQLGLHEEWSQLPQDVALSKGERIRVVTRFREPIPPETVNNILERVQGVKDKGGIRFLSLNSQQAVAELQLAQNPVNRIDLTSGELKRLQESLVESVMLEEEGEPVDISVEVFRPDVNIPLLAGATVLAGLAGVGAASVLFGD